MMQIDERLFQQEWYQEMPVDRRYLFLYLMSIASRKTGIFEINMRMINFGVNTGVQYTKEDVLTFFGDRIKLLPNHDNTAIFTNYIKYNWVHDKNVDALSSKLFIGIRKELVRYGLTLNDVLDTPNCDAVIGDDSDDESDCDDEPVVRHVVRFVPPTVDEVKEYCKERNNGIDAEQFVAFYESKGWMIGKNKMKNWKAAIATWERKDRSNGNGKTGKQSGAFLSGKVDADFQF